MPDSSLAPTAEPQAGSGGEGGAKRREKRRTSSQKSGSYLQDVHRALPASMDAEKGVLCSILLDPTRLIDECVTRQITDEYFHHPPHALVYRTILLMYDGQRPVDLVSLTQFLEDRHQIEEAGGHATLSDLFTFIPSPANALYYLDILREKHLLRKIIATCGEYAARAYDEQSEVTVLLDEVEAKILKIGDDRFSDRAPTIRELTLKTLDAVDALMQNRGQIGGLSTGFARLDELTDGLHPGEMFVIAARPSMGKTALAMNIAEHLAVEAGKAVAIYSLEMSAQQLMQRLLCSMARVNLKNLRTRFATSSQTKSLASAAKRLSECRMFIDDTPSLGILELRAHARRLHKREALDLIVIDYLQLLRSPSKRGLDNRQVEVSEISSGIKAIAKELGVPVIVLAQLNRNPEARAGDTKGLPRLSDLRESGSIEQDADVVALLWRKQYYANDEEAKQESEGVSQLIIAKQRNGPVGDVPLTFLNEFTRFEDMAPERAGAP